MRCSGKPYDDKVIFLCGAGMFNNILFICVGNICRSPLAEYWAREQLEKSGVNNIYVSSAGLQAMRLSPIAPESQAILTRFQIDASNHFAKQVEENHILKADIIFTMEAWQKKELSIAFPGSHGKIFCLGKWRDEEIIDPYRQGTEIFEQVFELIKNNWDVWQKKLWKA
ncbi:MAG: hypothetical protein ACD_29C00112G0004 [uncultured bacterium]|nr:MAG: hypothetical protein ACD_29C00112G0004 [uncultured bacterium]